MPKSSSDDTAVIIGVFSRVKDDRRDALKRCGEDFAKPTVYTLVTKYLTWIKDNMKPGMKIASLSVFS